MNEINEFKLEKVERQTRNLTVSEMNKILDYTCCALEVGLCLLSFQPFFAIAALGYFITAQMEKCHEKEIRDDLECVKSIKNEKDFEEYKVERIETCEEEINCAKKEEKVYGIASALALGGMFLAPVVCFIPLYIGIYGLLTAIEKENIAQNDYARLNNYECEINSQTDKHGMNDVNNRGKVKTKAIPDCHELAYAN